MSRTPRHALLLMCFLLALMAALMAPARATHEGPVVAGLGFDRALRAPGEGNGFPSLAVTREVALPDDWARTAAGSDGPFWYRVGFTGAPDSAERLRALYVPRVCSNLRVLLNGAVVHSAGHMREPITYQCHQPQLVALPAALLSPGLNVLDVQVAGHALNTVASRHRAASLSAMELGWHDDLVLRQVRDAALSIALPQAFSAILLLLGGFMFVLGFARRQHSHLAYFGALCLGWALGEARLWLRALPVSNTAAEFLLASLLPFITFAGVQFMLRHARLRLRLADVGLPLQCALMPLSLVLAGPARLYPMVMAWEIVFMLEVLAASLLFLRALRQQQRGAGLLSLTWVAVVLAGGVEFSTQITGVRAALGSSALLVPPLMFVIVGLYLVHQHGRAFNESEKSRGLLEQRVREATAEVERNYAQLAEARVEQVTERERKRIAADLHDDLGAKLLTIVHTSDSERISTLAREALEEMRLSVRGLTGRAVLLADAIGDWRAEIVSRLGQAGIEAHWSSPDDAELLQRLSARAYVQTTRILREATSNIIKHSGASRCNIDVAVAEGDFMLVIRDNGNGIAPDVEQRIDRGHGLASMKGRAKQLQGQCLVESGPGYGTVIRLTLPMDRAIEGA